jgi:proliferating cell nuclear antigen
VIRILSEAWREILEDGNLECDETGIRINCIDNTRTVFVQCELTNFETYHCPEKLYIGVNMSKFAKIIKMISNTETIGMYVDEKSPDSLQIVYQDRDMKKISHTELAMLDLDTQSYVLPPVNFQSVITMPSQEFQQIIRNLSSISTEVEITKVGTQLTFSTTGKPELFRHSVTFHGLTFQQDEDPDEVIKGTFLLQHLNMFIKCTNLSPFVEIYLKNECALVVRYSCGSLGHIKFCAAPRNQPE